MLKDQGTITHDIAPVMAAPTQSGPMTEAEKAEQQAKQIHARTEGHGDDDPDRTILYLAYGSNLAAKNFLDRRGVRPVSQINVLVPELRLTFDQPGLPYLEPCFATTEFRDPASDDPPATATQGGAAAAAAADRSRYAEAGRLLATATHKQPWRKPLVGVAYEVTPADYAKIIRTEGGGMAYQDVLVDCFPFPAGFTPEQEVPLHPEAYAKPFRAHTLLSFSTALKVKTYEERRPSLHGGTSLDGNGHGLPMAQRQGKQTDGGEAAELLPGSEPPRSTWQKYLRPHKGYSQPSQRYKNLLVTGAAEHALPEEYQEYLAATQAYHVTSFSQKIARAIIVAVFLPVEIVLMTLMIMLADKETGKSPQWLGFCRRCTAVTVWTLYDWVLGPMFGDGEKTEEVEEEEARSAEKLEAVASGGDAADEGRIKLK
ncbi:hypothetical protein KEM52_005656 [Ascosphaera acerosa]|nr:hypothetical protein KEM52_005656 [Ascosphaera acerosa]